MQKHILFLVGLLLCLSIGLSGLHSNTDAAIEKNCSTAVEKKPERATACSLKKASCPTRQEEMDEAPRKLRPSSTVKLAKYELN